MSVKFEFDFESFTDLRARIESAGSDIETELNQILKNEGKKTIEPGISNLIPVGTRKGAHAKNSKWATQKLGNLEIEIKASKKFKYLAFPNLGIGKRNPTAQEFMELGRDEAVPKLVEVTQQKLIEKLEEVF